MTSQPPRTSIDAEPLGELPPDPDLQPDPSLPPTAVPEAQLERERTWTLPKILLWAGIALLGGVAWTMIAIVRGETVNAMSRVPASPSVVVASAIDSTPGCGAPAPLLVTRMSSIPTHSSLPAALVVMTRTCSVATPFAACGSVTSILLSCVALPPLVASAI